MKMNNFEIIKIFHFFQNDIICSIDIQRHGNRSGLFALFQIDSIDISFLFLKYLTKSVTSSQHSVIYPQSQSSSNLDGECSHLPVRDLPLTYM